MKKQILFLTLSLISATSFCQVKFEKGYFINNENQRIEGLIKNYDWENAPVGIEFKTDENALSENKSINEVKEFEITGASKYRRAVVDIDRSETELSKLLTNRNPEWSKEVLFLKVLVEGKATLFQYDENNFQKFFYSVSDTSIRQLIYKTYSVVDQKLGNMAYNNDFRQQLWKDIRLETADIRTCETINYNRRELENYFKLYNSVGGANSEIARIENKNRELFFLKLTPGINHSSMTINRAGSVLQNTYSEKNMNYRIGLEFGFVLPFNKNKWDFMFEPTYQCFIASQENFKVNFSTIEFPVGVRYNLFLAEQVKLFVDAYFNPGIKVYVKNNLETSSDIGVGPHIAQTDISDKNCLAFGGGINYRKFSLEFRYYTKTKMIGDYLKDSSGYQIISFIAGYQLFKIKH